MRRARWTLHGVTPSANLSTTTLTIATARGEMPGLRLAQVGRLTALLSPPPSDMESTRAARTLARRHHRLLSILCENVTVAPARLGQGFGSITAACRTVAGEEGRWQELLQRLHDGVEISVLIAGSPMEPKATGSYLRRRAEARTGLDTLRRSLAKAGEDLFSMVEPDCRAARIEHRGKAPEIASDLSLLVPRTRAEAVMARLREAAVGMQGLALTLRGPWPPYSFVEEGAA
ncbi:MAG: GvpL/GvpF family gas vesicle protein [Pseudomonadota bacterium]